MVRLVLLSLLALAALPCTAQYPGKPIRIVIPFVAGGSSDIVGRAIGSKFQEFLHQPAVVENRPGANGAIAAELVAKSDADGYTILVGSIGVFSINAALFKDLRYQPLRDFAPITLAVTTPNVLIAKPALAPDSVKELVELAKKNPGRLAYCSSGSGSSDHLTGEVFRHRAGAALARNPRAHDADRLRRRCGDAGGIRRLHEGRDRAVDRGGGARRDQAGLNGEDLMTRIALLALFALTTLPCAAQYPDRNVTF